MGPIIMKICIKNARISRSKSSGPCLKKNSVFGGAARCLKKGPTGDFFFIFATICFSSQKRNNVFLPK